MESGTLTTCSSRWTSIVDPDAIHQILEKIQNNWGECIGLFVHGSAVFLEGVQEPQDIDLLAVVDDSSMPLKRPIASATSDSQFVWDDKYEVSLYAKSFWFQKLAANMDLTMITCAYLPERFVLRRLPDNDDNVGSLMTWRDNWPRRRELVESILSYAGYTWRKAQRVLDKWKDPYKSSKNVYFAFRILELGRQLLTYDRCTDLQASNSWWYEAHRVYSTYRVEPGSFDIVEAALGGAFERERERFRQAILMDDETAATPEETDETQIAVDDDVRNGTVHDVCCAICHEEMTQSSAQPSPNCENNSPELCSNNWRSLVCGHAMHLNCIVNQIRRQQQEIMQDGTCPVCHQSVRVVLQKKRAIAGELDRLGIRSQQQSAPRDESDERQFGGYPATVVTQGERMDTMEDGRD